MGLGGPNWPFFLNSRSVKNYWIILKFNMGVPYSEQNYWQRASQASEAKEGTKGPPGGQRPPAHCRC